MGIVEDLIEENASLRGANSQRHSLAAQRSRSTIMVSAVIILCVLSATFVVAITMVRPAVDNQSLIMIVLGVVVPVITGLMAGALQQVNNAVNGRLTQLLELTAKSSKAEGHLAGLMTPVVGVEDARLAEGKAIGVEQERTRTEHSGPDKGTLP